MQNRRDAGRCAEIFRVGAEFKQSLGYRFEKQPIHNFMISQSDGVKIVRQRKHHMEITRVQQTTVLLFNPLLLREGLALGTMAVTA